ncbi:MAG: hypothetical protein JWL61_3764 [Gemmatimonadetes bacterium]|jgi:hypothetical protein|nr:hypothetical protein [Gemmatimonadota bacterium]
MVELAEVVGLEEHLTVPSRGHSHLVDLWFAIKRSSVGLEWERQFTRLAQGSNELLSSLGVFEPVPFTERRGWIVARCADGNSISQRAVEDLVRALVAEANARIAAPVAIAVGGVARSTPRESWRERVRTASASIVGSALTPRRQSDVDIASG